MDHAEQVAKLAEAHVLAGDKVLSEWFHNRAFREAYTPDPDLFYAEYQQHCARIMAARGPKLDSDSLLLELHRSDLLKFFEGGADGYQEMIGGTPVQLDPWAAVRELISCNRRLLLRRALQDALRDATAGEGLSGVEDALRGALEPSKGGSAESLHKFRDVMAAGYNASISASGKVALSTGFRRLDGCTGGIQRGHVWLLGANTNWGKSSLAIAIADSVLIFGRKVLVVSAEDSPALYGRRILARRARVGASRLRDGRLSMEEHAAATDALEKAPNMPFFLDGIGMPAESMAANIRSLCMSERFDLVIVDYVQAIRSVERHESRRHEINRVGRLLTDAVKRSCCAGIFLSQVTIEQGQKRPSKENIRESRDLAHAAEFVVLGYLEGDKRMLFIDKAKDAPAGLTVELGWDSRSASFVDSGSEFSDIGDELDRSGWK